MRLALLLVFVAVPLLEIALLIKLGGAIGFWTTLAIVIGTAIVGTSIMHRQGLQAMIKAQDSLAEGKLPLESVVDGAFLLMSGAFLLTPGLITDTIGFLFLIPPLRQFLARWGYNRFFARAGKQRAPGYGAQQEDYGRPAGPDRGSGLGPDDGRDFGSGPVIDGEFQRLDDPPPKSRR